MRRSVTDPEPATSSGGDGGGSLDLDGIVEAAGDLVDHVGPEELSLTAVADALGVSQPALYRHVDGLAGLWRALGLSTRQLLADHLAHASVGRTGAAAVAAVADAWRDFAHAHPGRYRSVDRHAVSGDDALEAAVQHTVDVLERSLRGFSLDGDALAHAAQTLRSALHGFVSYELGHGNPQSLDADESLHQLVSVMCAGFDRVAHEAAREHVQADRETSTSGLFVSGM